MPLSENEKTEFVDAYTKALVTSWSSEEFTARLESDPRSALAEVGLSIPADARIQIVRTIPDEPVQAQPSGQKGHLDRQIALWQVGLDTGYFEVYIPETPQVDTSDLTAAELEDVAAGFTLNCCCCPCSCCT